MDIKSILVAMDFSEFSRWASERAAMLGVVLNSNVVDLVTVKEAGLPGTLALVLRTTPAAAETILVDRAMRELALISAHLTDNYGIMAPERLGLGSLRKRSWREQMNCLRI